MALDSENKRRSAVGIRGLRLWGLPRPSDGQVSSDDRRNLAGLYSGLTTQSEARVNWVEVAEGTVAWVQISGPASDAIQSGTDTTTWVKISEVND